MILPTPAMTEIPDVPYIPCVSRDSPVPDAWHPEECAAREKCRACWKVSAVGFVVPDDVWKMSVPDELLTDVLCLSCFCAFADERGVQWDESIEFFPVSRITAIEALE